jgi:WD40 repeat protein/serine/threonine protein kinase
MPFDLTADQFSEVSKLLDESLEMASEQRELWLTNLARSNPQLAVILTGIFSARQDCEESGFLEGSHSALDELCVVDHDAGLVGTQFGPYRVLSVLGHGGMGSVWLAERVDGLFKRQVALKLVHPYLIGRGIMERLAREREILGSLNHPHIAQLFDAGFSASGQPYLALEYVVGTPITNYCDDHRLSVRERLTLFRQVLSAVQYAHARLVIHRDLKPSNVLVSEGGEVRLLDFGIAKLLVEGFAKDSKLTEHEGRALTPEYAAPEQIEGAPVTIAADVYGLGVMLYEILVGRSPYSLRRESRGALEEAILKSEPMAPSRVTLSEDAASKRAATPARFARAVGGDIDTIVLKALQKAPTDRYPTANAFAEDIARFLCSEPVLARRDSLAYRVVKFVRRNRWGVAAAAILFLSLAGGLAATTYLARVAASQRDAAVQAQLHSLIQTAAVRLKDGDIPGALSMMLAVLSARSRDNSWSSDALTVFQEARAADAQMLALTGHRGRVRCAAFSPDGRRIVTGAADGTIRVWDSATGWPIAVVQDGESGVTSVAFTADGRRLVTGSGDNTAHVRDTVDWRLILTLIGHTARIGSVAVSPDGRRIATASDDRTARIWDAATGLELARLAGHGALVESVAFSPDGARLLTASDDRTARIWNATTGRQIKIINGHSDWVSSGAFSPDGRRIATASYDDTVRIWDAASGTQLMVLNGHSQWVTSVAFSPDGTRVVSAAYDRTARIWDIATGRELQALRGHLDWVTSAVFSPDGRRVATGSADRTARIWDVSGGAEIRRIGAEPNIVASATFSPDGRRVILALEEGTARVVEVASGATLLTLKGHTDRVATGEFSPDASLIVTASLDRTARLWDAATGRELRVLRGHTERLLSAQFSSDGQRIVTSSHDNTARIWDAASGRELLVLRGHTDHLASARFSPDGLRVVTASDDRTARIWDAQSGLTLLTLNVEAGFVDDASFSPDGKRVVTAADDNLSRIWDATTGRELVVLSGHSDRVSGATFAPDGRRILTASLDRTARIWDADTGEPLQVLRGHTDLIESAVFSRDGRFVLTASDDKTARIWDARTLPLETQIAGSRAAEFDPLPRTQRSQLGLPEASDVRRWAAGATKCDLATDAPYDPDRRSAGIVTEEIVADVAIAACAGAASMTADKGRASYRLGRALESKRDFAAARRRFEAAIVAGYRTANVDLARILVESGSGTAGESRALSLLERAWAAGVTISAFELGRLYEQPLPGMSMPDGRSSALLAPDSGRAWSWYQKGADAAEPNALAKFAEREDGAASAAPDSTTRNAHWLAAFSLYAAATERARLEDWPDAAWRGWRYRRASLARLLAREGLMSELAASYTAMRPTGAVGRSGGVVPALTLDQSVR